VPLNPPSDGAAEALGCATLPAAEAGRLARALVGVLATVLVLATRPLVGDVAVTSALPPFPAMATSPAPATASRSRGRTISKATGKRLDGLLAGGAGMRAAGGAGDILPGGWAPGGGGGWAMGGTTAATAAPAATSWYVSSPLSVRTNGFVTASFSDGVSGTVVASSRPLALTPIASIRTARAVILSGPPRCFARSINAGMATSSGCMLRCCASSWLSAMLCNPSEQSRTMSPASIAKVKTSGSTSSR
jgi:hypothetical protein